MKKWTSALQIAAVYVGTVIGAGFATGKEIVEFFTQYGFYGLFAILLAGYLFITLGTKIMVKAIAIQAPSFEEFNVHLFGRTIAKGMNVFTLIMLIGVCAVMLSGAEALFYEQLGISKTIGSFVTIALCLLVMAVGVKGLFAVNTFVVPLLIIFNLSLLFISLNSFSDLENLFFFHEKIPVWKAVASAFAYTAFNLTLAQAVLVPIAVEVNEVAIVKLGGLLGGLILTLILISSYFTLLTLPNFQVYEIPMAVIVRQVAQNIYFLYLMIIYGEIFTSLIGNMYGIERQLRKYISWNSFWIHSAMIFIVYLFSRVEYGKLLGLLYPIFGYISLIFLALLWIKPVKK